LNVEHQTVGQFFVHVYISKQQQQFNEYDWTLELLDFHTTPGLLSHRIPTGLGHTLEQLLKFLELQNQAFGKFISETICLQTRGVHFFRKVYRCVDSGRIEKLRVKHEL
jgi:hypothetical protein